MLVSLLLACKEPPEGAHPVPVYEPIEQDSAVVWNGFTQVWGYNHRVNSFGDYVGPVECDAEGCHAELVHSAASGSGSDTASWRTSHTLVRAPGVRFVQGFTRFTVDLDDAEGETHTFVEAEDFPVEAGVQAVVLGGWDLWADADADRLADLDVAVGEVVDGRFDVTVSLGADCDSIECEKGDRGVAYEIVVSWLAVASDDALALSSASFADTYAWEAGGLDDELRLADLAMEGELPVAAPVAGASALAFRRVSVKLDDDHHMAEWATEIEAGRDDRFWVTLGFKQWNAGTYWNPVSYIERGDAEVAAEVVRLSFAEGCAQATSAEGEARWVADGRPSGSDAVHTQDLWFGGCG
jgi:hypothetical protein